MFTAYSLQLTEDQQAELMDLRDHAPKPYLRERAAALLKVAAGQSIVQVASSGLLRRRKVDTVCAWVHGYERAGIAGVGIRKGRGRKPASFPATR